MTFFRAFFYFLLLCFNYYDQFGVGIKHTSAAGKKPDAVEKTHPARQVHGYRMIHWCVTGQDEPELHTWPLNQFVPLLRRTNRFHSDSSNFRYNIKFNEISTDLPQVGNEGGLFKSVHIILTAEKKMDINLNIYEEWEPLPLEGLIIQANHNPASLGLPAGEFFSMSANDEGVVCSDCENKFWARIIPCRKRAVIDMVHPTILIFHHEMLPAIYKTWDDIVGYRSEIHANFRWYNPLCAETRRLTFFVMAVRSFEKNEYDIIKMGPYEVQTREQMYQSDFVPSPYFEYFSLRAFCHKRSSTDIQTLSPSDPSKVFEEIEMSSRFDCCTKNEDNPKDPIAKQYREVSTTYNCDDSTKENPLTKAFGSESWLCNFPRKIKPCTFNTQPRETAERNFYGDKCETCATLPPTTAPVTTVTPNPIMKRSKHGLLMIMTNFCLQPIVIFVARFYKETFNQHTFKGVKLWYWMHMLGGMVSSLVSYFGYFSGGQKKANEAHVVLGNTYIMLLALCYVTAWGRHKNVWITTIAELLHAGLGYTVIIMAIASVATTEMGYTPKLLCYLMAAFQILFTLTQTCHICLWDCKIGMKPSRRHLPTVEARFDAIRIPGSSCRVIMLLMFSVITVTLCVVSTFYA